MSYPADVIVDQPLPTRNLEQLQEEEEERKKRAREKYEDPCCGDCYIAPFYCGDQPPDCCCYGFYCCKCKKT